MTPKLYTLVLDYAGGTYISQFRAGDLHSGLEDWAERAGEGDAGMGDLRKDDLRLLAKDKAIAITNVKNVHCVSATSSSNKLMLGHIIETFE